MDEDTQWPRYEVFQQSRTGAPFRNVGSVHAPDAEIAFLNARDVFVRRPQTVNLWVAPAGAILTRTREELSAHRASREELAEEKGPSQTYMVFSKRSHRRSMTYVTYRGDVDASGPLHALGQALSRFGGEEDVVWWIVPASAITSNRPEEADTLFAPAHDKSYRLPGDYHTRTMMDDIRKEQAQTDNDSN